MEYVMININPLSELDGSNLDYDDRDLMAAINVSRMTGNSIVNIGQSGKIAASKPLSDSIMNSPSYSSVSFSEEVNRYNYLTNYYFSMKD